MQLFRYIRWEIIPNPWRVETLQLVVPAVLSFCLFLTDLEVDEDGMIFLKKIASSVLPRKEVIQPHLPVRLPCYDFVPIAGSALDTSLPCGLGQWLQAYPTFMT